MAIAISISFPLGRYHCTPWDRSANEGAVEWPPSPWRLLRALYATWKQRLPDLDETSVLAALESVSGPPEFVLPEHGLAHTRHYMPDGQHLPGVKTSTDKVIDAFVTVAPAERVLFFWPDTNLGDSERRTLQALLAELPYLGRAESVCDASLCLEAPSTREAICRPAGEGAAATTSVLVAERPLSVESLTVTTTALRSSGYLDPPGARWLRYELPAPSDTTSRPRRVLRKSPTAIRLAIDAPALPAYTSVLVMAEWLRKAAQSQYGKQNNGATSVVLSGRSEGSNYLRAQHAHAHFLGLPDSTGRKLETFVVWAPGGFSADDLRAIAAIESLRIRREDSGRLDGPIPELRPVWVAPEALGIPEHVAPEITAQGGEGALEWESLTPFLSARHLNKVTSRRLCEADGYEDPYEGFAVEEIKREAALRSLPAIEVVTLMRAAGVTTSWLDFRRHRAWKGERLPDASRGIGARIRFSAPVRGPLSLGKYSHYGLGLFTPVI